MLVLGIETATSICSVALIQDRLIGEFRLNIKNIHARKLSTLTRQLMQNSSRTYKELESIAISIGPGSFTGLRIGLSFAKGLAVAHDIPLISVSTLEALAVQAPIREGTICPILRSKANEVFVAVYEKNHFKVKCIQNPLVIEIGKIKTLVPENTIFTGYANQLEELNILTTPDFFSLPSAYTIASIGRQKYQDGCVDDLDTLEPLYYQDFIAGKPKKQVKF